MAWRGGRMREDQLIQARKIEKKRLFQMPLEGLIELFQIGLFMRVRYATIVYQSIS